MNTNRRNAMFKTLKKIGYALAHIPLLIAIAGIGLTMYWNYQGDQFSKKFNEDSFKLEQEWNRTHDTNKPLTKQELQEKIRFTTPDYAKNQPYVDVATGKQVNPLAK